MIAQLIQEFMWKKELIQHLFNAEDVDTILSTLLGIHRKPDRYYWKYEDSRTYTVKSGYLEAKRLERVKDRRHKDKGECSNGS